MRRSPPTDDDPPPLLPGDHVSHGHVSRASVMDLQARVTAVTRADTELGLRGDIANLARGAAVVRGPGPEVSTEILS